MSYMCYDLPDGMTFDSVMEELEYAVEDDSYYYVKTPWCDGDLGSEMAIRIDKNNKAITSFYESDCAAEIGRLTGDYEFLTYKLYRGHQVSKEDIIKHFKEKAA